MKINKLDNNTVEVCKEITTESKVIIKIDDLKKRKIELEKELDSINEILKNI